MCAVCEEFPLRRPSAVGMHGAAMGGHGGDLIVKPASSFWLCIPYLSTGERLPLDRRSLLCQLTDIPGRRAIRVDNGHAG